jgi:hypothetical protein
MKKIEVIAPTCTKKSARISARNPGDLSSKNPRVFVLAYLTLLPVVVELLPSILCGSGSTTLTAIVSPFKALLVLYLNLNDSTISLGTFALMTLKSGNPDIFKKFFSPFQGGMGNMSGMQNMQGMQGMQNMPGMQSMQSMQAMGMNSYSNSQVVDLHQKLCPIKPSTSDS